MTNLHETDRLPVELLPCPLFISDDFPHDVRIDEHVSGRAVRNVISCSCGIVFNGAYGDAGSLDGAANAREHTIAAWNRRALTAMGGKAEPVVPRERVLDRICVFREMEPEEDETWRGWYWAAFEMLADEVRALPAASASPVQARTGEEPHPSYVWTASLYEAIADVGSEPLKCNAATLEALYQALSEARNKP